MSTALEAAKAVQQILGVELIDGIIGPQSHAAFTALGQAAWVYPESPWPPAPVVVAPVVVASPAIAASPAPTGVVHSVMASSFADPADIRAFNECKAAGKSDEDCFALGDNGIGKWGDSTAPGSGPSCALPPEDWEQFGAAARGKSVEVQCATTGKTVIAKLKDTMPRLSNITNGAGIDLNYDTVTALGLKVPLMQRVTWQWA